MPITIAIKYDRMANIAAGRGRFSDRDQFEHIRERANAGFIDVGSADHSKRAADMAAAFYQRFPITP